MFFMILASCVDESKIEPCMRKDWSNIKIIEGVTSAYIPMDKGGHGSNEIFMVDSVIFTYSDYLLTGFYNNSCVKGGLICGDGQNVRITYRTKCDYLTGIEKIELLDH